MKGPVTVIVADPRWKKRRGLPAQISRIAAHALKRGRRSQKSASLTILLESDRALRNLNRRFRGRDKSTNVLSFPALPNPERHLGDVAIAFGVAEKEAKSAAKRLSDHAMHLAVHGVLHLLGFDHERARDARRMERLEAKILADFGLSDPYESHPNPA